MRELLPVLGLWTFPCSSISLISCCAWLCNPRKGQVWIQLHGRSCCTQQMMDGSSLTLRYVSSVWSFFKAVSRSCHMSGGIDFTQTPWSSQVIPFRKLTTKNLGKGAANKHGSLSFNLSTPTAPQPSLPFCWLQLEPVQSFQSFQWTQTRSWEVPRLSVESYRPFPIVWRTLVNM